MFTTKGPQAAEPVKLLHPSYAAIMFITLGPHTASLILPHSLKQSEKSFVNAPHTALPINFFCVLKLPCMFIQFLNKPLKNE